jgi:hypothetical protein
MNAPAPISGRGGGLLTVALFGATLGVLGLLSGLPYYLGPAVAAGGVIASVLARRRRPSRTAVGTLVPALLAVTVLAAAAPVGAATELFAGLSGLAFLLWLADDPTRPVGGGRRAAPTIGPVALGVGLVWVIDLGVSGRAEEVGLAGALIAIGLIVLGLLIVSVSRRPPEPRASPPPRGRTGGPGTHPGREEEPFPWELEA